MQRGTKLKQYRPGTFDKRVAYGLRDRKLMLVARGILKGFRVRCHSEADARNLTYALRVRATRIVTHEGARFGLKVKLDGRTVYVMGIRRRGGGSNHPQGINDKAHQI
jgi:hypothetical protein